MHIKVTSLLSVCLLLFLCSCATIDYYNLEESGYKGDVVTISDSMGRFSRYGAHFFTLNKIDGQLVANSAVASVRTGQYSGYIDPTIISRNVKPGKTVLSIRASRANSAPAFGWFGASYPRIDKDVEVLLEANRTYEIVGFLSRQFASISIVDDSGKLLVGPFEKFSNLSLSESAKKALREEAFSRDVEEHFLALPKDEFFLRLPELNPSLSQIESKLGRFTDTVKRAEDYWGQITTDYIYSEFGTLRTLSIGEHQYIKSVRADFNISELSLNDYERMINNLPPRGFKRFVLLCSQQNIKDIAILDLFANKLLKDKYTKSAQHADTLAWIEKILAASGSYRYLSLLQHIKNDESVDSKIVKYANKSIKQLKRYKNQKQYSPFIKIE